ncbi:MAG: alcohol dehydrogenase catalytic domain-containing protein, partial [Alphaproteobacteria bacterium]|nr:alcohol dehydrogenase catalytic domain-containing protein [Alphaproteobacteria bacterium]
MKRVVVTGESQCGLEDFDDPGVAENYAKIKIHAAPLCTEFHTFLRGMKRPLGGHEAAGEVVEIGPAVTMVKPGDRVAVMPQSGCGVCDLCTSGDHIYCRDKKDPKAIC